MVCLLHARHWGKFYLCKVSIQSIGCITAFSYTYRYVCTPSCFSPCGAWYQASAFSQLTHHTGLVFWGGVSRSQAGLNVTVQPRITLNLNSSGFYLLTTNQATPSPSFLFIPLAATLPFFLPPLAGSLFPPNRSPLQLPSYTQSTSLQPHPIPLP